MKFAVTNEMRRELKKGELLILKDKLGDFTFIKIPKDCKEIVLRDKKRKEKSMELPEEAVKGLISALEDFRAGRYTTLTNYKELKLSLKGGKK